MRVIYFVLLLLALNVVNAEVKIGILFAEASSEGRGIAVAIENNKKFPYKFFSSCDPSKMRDIASECKILFGPGSCIFQVGSELPETGFLYIPLFSKVDSSEFPAKKWIFTLPQFPLSNDIAEKCKEPGRANKELNLEETADEVMTKACDATGNFLKAIELSTLSSEKAVEQPEKIREQLSKIKTIQVAFAGVRKDSTPEGKQPDFANPIQVVLEKGDRVIETEKSGSWLKVKPFSENDPKWQKITEGWIHGLLVESPKK